MQSSTSDWDLGTGSKDEYFPCPQSGLATAEGDIFFGSRGRHRVSLVVGGGVHTHGHRWMTAGTNEPTETTIVLRLTHMPRQAEMLKVARHPSKTTVRDGLTTRQVAVTVAPSVK